MDYIYQKENSLDKELCDKIIDIFENSQKKYDGVTNSGIFKHIKNTTDLHFNFEKELFKDIDAKIYSELNKNLYAYIDKINEKCRTIQYESFTDSGFNIQKYIKNEGQYIYHNDETITKDNRKRLLTYIWYLNDVDDGGETEFFGSIKIKPQCGKLIIFPASWTFPHSGLTPKSNDKYIITGWIYKKFIPLIN